MKQIVKFLLIAFLLAGCGSVSVKKTTFTLNETKVQGTNSQVCSSAEPFGSLALVNATACVDDQLVDQKWTIKNDGNCTCFAVDATTKITLGQVECTTGLQVALTDTTAYFSLMCGAGDPKIPAPVFTFERTLVPVVEASPTEAPAPFPTEAPTEPPINQ